MSDQSTPGASAPSMSNATIIESSQPNSAAMDEAGWKSLADGLANNTAQAPSQYAQQNQGAPSDVESVRTRAANWCRASAAEYLEAVERGDHKFVRAYREA